MSRTTLLALTTLLSVGCGSFPDWDLDPPTTPSWNGEAIRFICNYDEVTYTHDSSQMPGTAHPAVDGCFELPAPFAEPWNTDPEAWASTLYSLCTTECSAQVEAEAASQGRVVLGDTCPYFDEQQDAVFQLDNCLNDAKLVKTQELSLTYKPIVGNGITVSGVVDYVIASDRGGETLSLQELALDEPLVITTGVRDASALLGYPEGTEISVGRVSMQRLNVSLDARGNAVIPAGELGLFAFVTVTEPDKKPANHTLGATVPFELSLSTDTGLDLGEFRDGFGGVFSVR